MSETGSQLPETRRIPVGNLLLDSENPQLPERLSGGFQSEILDFLHKQGALEEPRCPEGAMYGCLVSDKQHLAVI